MRTKLSISYVLIAGGASLLFLGARDYFESHLGQAQAASEFEAVVPRRVVVVKDEAPRRDAAPREEAAPRRGEPLAKLAFPRLDKQVFVIEGDSDAELRRGPGHLPGTAMPGAKGNCVIAGHRDTHFRVLKDLRTGDQIVLTTRSGRFTYRVKNTQVVSPNNTSSLQPTTDSELNLITCYPFHYVGSAPKRFVVQAELAGGA
jgi:sortase A